MLDVAAVLVVEVAVLAVVVLVVLEVPLELHQVMAVVVEVDGVLQEGHLLQLMETMLEVLEEKPLILMVKQLLGQAEIQQECTEQYHDNLLHIKFSGFNKLLCLPRSSNNR